MPRSPSPAGFWSSSLLLSSALLAGAAALFAVGTFVGAAGGVPVGIRAGVSADSPPAAAPPSNFNPAYSLAPLVSAVESAVVNVYVTSIQRTGVPQALQQFYGLPGEREVKGQGSGFVISPDGYILTNAHVVGEAKDISVKFSTGEEYPAKVVGADTASDVALLQIIANRSLPWLQLGNSDTLAVGDWVVAVGNPLGLGHTVTAGILSGKGRNISDQLFEEFLQTDASINPGNSGGPLIALDGKVVGMNTAIIQGANSVGFAIPSAYLQTVVPQLQKTGRVSRGYLGVQMGTLNETGRKQLGLTAGVVVVGVTTGGPAAAAGLKSGDVILKIGGVPVKDQLELVRQIAALTPGTEVTLAVMREGNPKDIKVKLGTRPQSP